MVNYVAIMSKNPDANIDHDFENPKMVTFKTRPTPIDIMKILDYFNIPYVHLYSVKDFIADSRCFDGEVEYISTFGPLISSSNSYH